jgi:hypothetical protein
MGIRMSDPATRYTVVTDSQVVYHWLLKFNGGGNAHAEALLHELWSFLRRHRRTIQPLWIPSEAMAETGADGASRMLRASSHVISKTKFENVKLVAQQFSTSLPKMASLVKVALDGRAASRRS